MRLPGLRYWIRNVARDPNSFWLPTATGRFYPDFVARLDDGRLLVVKYKGPLLADEPETREKRAIGALWERESAREGLFLMAEKTVNGKDVRRQLMKKIAGYGRWLTDAGYATERAAIRFMSPFMTSATTWSMSGVRVSSAVYRTAVSNYAIGVPSITALRENSSPPSLQLATSITSNSPFPRPV